MLYKDTDIDSVLFDPDRCEVRGKNINELIGCVDLIQMYALVVLGIFPSRAMRDSIESLICRAFDALNDDHPAIKAVFNAIEAGVPPMRATISGLAIGVEDIICQIMDRRARDIKLSTEHVRGIVLFAILPRLLIASITRVQTESLESVEKLGFSGRILLGLGAEKARAAKAESVKAFEAALVSLQAGLGFVNSAVLLARIAAGTKTDLERALIAGLTGCGRSGAGESDKAIELLLELQNCKEADASSKMFRKKIIQWCLNNNGTPGFGHRLFRIDPRAQKLYAHLKYDLGWKNDGFRKYESLCKVMLCDFGLYPNVEGLAAVVFLELGLPAKCATGLVLCMRSAAMTAHIFERRKRPTSGVTSATARAFIQKTLAGWL
jgi:citrate synthase